ncbi:glycyl radical protein [Parasphaerochaeta coccoides]|uniref:Pyruvate formate-lyase n=1 Tax=Parasphaerochaeta coccoides (strain ATCC BAA-1237 / DSM 17374 / SPN1) TaxID=760011 RepID=F4GJ52_PARC1|nr:formate C-acetyltransferase/glycerol dehydratase family glycyl radical enzyme [Parasphaerochaeta coccoides]AEC01347.1 pyruvate formate-lyase [Parasphaerochaeta coccoides DSM 17374]
MTEREKIQAILPLERSRLLKNLMLAEPRYVSIEQARIITKAYQDNEGTSRCIQRALSLKAALTEISIRILPDELIVGNRTAGVRGGVVFPETGASWVDREFETLPTRPQDMFNVHPEDIQEFRNDILPYWKGRSLEDHVRAAIGEQVDAIAKVVKINQKDHSQGHICPNTKKWLALGPAGILAQAQEHIREASGKSRDFYESIVISMQGACIFMERYAALAAEMSQTTGNESLMEVSRICHKLACEPARTFHEAMQSVWFLYVILQMEGNASSFSPGRMDQYVYPYYLNSRKAGMSLEQALEITECLWLKFNQLVYLRNSNSAKYFAGFPIGFNVAIGGQYGDGSDAVNDLSYLFLMAQEHLLLPQPNLSCRIHKNSPQEFLDTASRVIGLGSGMPQVFNDEAVIPALESHGVSHEDAMNYAIVGCVELTTHGNALGWSDAAMFNLVKALELTLNHGTDMLTGQKTGLDLGDLTTYESFEELEEAFARQIDYFSDYMVDCVSTVEKMHEQLLPTPFLSAVIDDCMTNGRDVTQGGAHYNFAGVQAIQVANIADSLAAIKDLVFGRKMLTAERLLQALRNDFKGDEVVRTMLLNKAPKYGNDIAWVDALGAKWSNYFSDGLEKYRNNRGGIYQMGLYTVSAHVPMGQNVGASADGRHARDPLADGGVSAMYGRDTHGPTALLHSVSTLPFRKASNGTLLNMKFLPEFFRTSTGIKKFSNLLRAFVDLGISHVQFNVVNETDLKAAQKEPEKYRGLTIRVAGYTAYFTELARDLQDEIIARTVYERI